MCGRTLLMKSLGSLGSSFCKISSLELGEPELGGFWLSFPLPYMRTTHISIDMKTTTEITQITSRVVLACRTLVIVSLFSPVCCPICWTSMQSGTLSTLIGRDPSRYSILIGAKVYAIATHLKVPFRVLLWHDKWLPCTERIYCRRPYAIQTQRKARNAHVP